MLRIIDLLVVAGFRVGEVLTLPRDCWVEETAINPRGRNIRDITTGETAKRCGLRYWPEKGGDPIVKWLPSCAVPLARRAVGDLVRLCEPARQAAAVLEKNPHRVPLPGNPDPDALLSIRELMKILPFPPTGCDPWLPVQNPWTGASREDTLAWRAQSLLPISRPRH